VLYKTVQKSLCVKDYWIRGFKSKTGLGTTASKDPASVLMHCGAAQVMKVVGESAASESASGDSGLGECALEESAFEQSSLHRSALDHNALEESGLGWHSMRRGQPFQCKALSLKALWTTVLSWIAC
jgi:hypothetical protein